MRCVLICTTAFFHGKERVVRRFARSYELFTSTHSFGDDEAKVFKRSGRIL